jgi:hypothetical protein
VTVVSGFATTSARHDRASALLGRLNGDALPARDAPLAREQHGSIRFERHKLRDADLGRLLH